MGLAMEKLCEHIAMKYFGGAPSLVTPLGGGFYGRVFLVDMSGTSQKMIVKIHLFPELAEKEARQLEILRSHAIVRMPRVHMTHHADSEVPYDAIVMEYIAGRNAGDSGLELSVKDRDFVAGLIVGNLISYHATEHKEGFGEIGAVSYVPEWSEYYKSIADETFGKAKVFSDKKVMDSETFSVVEKARERYEQIFYLPITEAGLIHGDYNTWNILLNEELTDVAAVIDPFNCRWADTEMDLYQLNNANGKDYRLLEVYSERVKLSENFPLKTCFYELFTEIAHYYDAGIAIGHSNIRETAGELARQMHVFGIG